MKWPTKIQDVHPLSAFKWTFKRTNFYLFVLITNNDPSNNSMKTNKTTIMHIVSTGKTCWVRVVLLTYTTDYHGVSSWFTMVQWLLIFTRRRVVCAFVSTKPHISPTDAWLFIDRGIDGWLSFSISQWRYQCNFIIYKCMNGFDPVFEITTHSSNQHSTGLSRLRIPPFKISNSTLTQNKKNS